MRVDYDDVAAALPSYEVGEEIGRGSWGIVFAGRHRQLGREVAIKELPPMLASDPEVRARFVVEARVLAALDHPHVVPVYDYVERESMCLLVMERLRGGTLADRLQHGRMRPQMACALVLATAAGLHHAHQRGLLHRDVKPENLLFSTSGALKVADFGIAKTLGGAATVATATGSVLGTPMYMAPEQVQGFELTPATDVYALGTILFMLLSGRLPFSSRGELGAILHRRINERPLALREAASELPPRLDEITSRALATAVADRYSTAEEFGVALAEVAVQCWGSRWLATTDVPVASAGPIVSAALGESRTHEPETRASAAMGWAADHPRPGPGHPGPRHSHPQPRSRAYGPTSSCRCTASAKTPQLGSGRCSGCPFGGPGSRGPASPGWWRSSRSAPGPSCSGAAAKRPRRP